MEIGEYINNHPCLLNGPSPTEPQRRCFNPSPAGPQPYWAVCVSESLSDCYFTRSSIHDWLCAERSPLRGLHNPHCICDWFTQSVHDPRHARRGLGGQATPGKRHSACTPSPDQRHHPAPQPRRLHPPSHRRLSMQPGSTSVEALAVPQRDVGECAARGSAAFLSVSGRERS